MVLEPVLVCPNLTFSLLPAPDAGMWCHCLREHRSQQGWLWRQRCTDPVWVRVAGSQHAFESSAAREGGCASGTHWKWRCLCLCLCVLVTPRSAERLCICLSLSQRTALVLYCLLCCTADVYQRAMILDSMAAAAAEISKPGSALPPLPGLHPKPPPALASEASVRAAAAAAGLSPEQQRLLTTTADGSKRVGTVTRLASRSLAAAAARKGKQTYTVNRCRLPLGPLAWAPVQRGASRIVHCTLCCRGAASTFIRL